MRNGIVSGTFQMTSTAPARYKIVLPAKVSNGQTLREEFTELVQLNAGNGFNGGSPLPYSDQIVFRAGTSCACETGYFDSSMPLLYPFNQGAMDYLTSFYTAGGASPVNPQCTVYTKKATPDTSKFPALKLNLITAPLTEVHINTATKFPCYAVWADGRQFTFSNCKTESYAATRATLFKEPTGCKCGKPIDIVFVLDRSSSISVREFYDQKGFVIDFANQFEFSPLKANLAIINFQSTSWIHLKLTDGISDANVNASVQSLGCPVSCDQNKGASCTGNIDACCCCCGTCISCGVRLGADQFPSGRKFAFKLLIVITDGFANTPSAGQTCTPDCNADLRAGTTYAISKVPDPTQIALYAVGVGSDRDVSAEQLLIVANGRQDHVLRRNSFSELASVNVELISRSCDQNLFPCGGCCGFCSCGKCQPPDTCKDETACDLGYLGDGQVCCTTQPKNCSTEAAADKCSTFVCKNGTCVANTTIQCGAPQNTTCFNRTCVPSTGLCKTSQTGVCPPQLECKDAAGCDDNNKCTIDNCTTDGGCVWTTINCTAKLPKDECSTVECDPINQGCYLKPKNISVLCDDNNLCTVDTCDKDVGCVHTPVTDCADKDLCTDDICDPLRGCIFVPKLCNISGNSSCKIAFCNETDGNCTFREVACAVPFPTTEVVAGAIGAAALVGIIIAAIICAAGAGAGGAYAYTQAQANGDLAVVNPNPLYQGVGNAGTNPLYKS